MDSLLKQRWEDLFEKAKRELETENCSNTLATASIQELKDTLNRSAIIYGRLEMVQLLEKIHPSLEHVQTYVDSINSASQSHPIGCLMWSGIRAVLQCAVSGPNALEEIYDMIAELSYTFATIERDLRIYPDRQELQWHLQDIYKAFLNFCVLSVRYFNKPPGWNLFSYLWNSSPQRNMKKTKAQIEKHIQNFKDEVQALHRAEVRASTVLGSTTGAGTHSRKKRKINAIEKFRNMNFYGREEYMASLHDKFSPGNAADSGDEEDLKQSPTFCVVHGLPGVGKTQIALEYAHRFEADYDALFWLPSEQESELTKNFKAIVRRLKKSDPDFEKDFGGEDSQVEPLEIAREWLQYTKRVWLVIFDNVEDIADIERYIPQQTRTRGSVILTTQHPNFRKLNANSHKIQVSSFDDESSVELLFRLLERNPTDDRERSVVGEMTHMFGGLPIAIATIAGAIKEAQSSPHDFLQTMKHSSAFWGDDQNPCTMSYEKSLDKVFEIALHELQERNENARKLINILAFLNPDSIPESLLLAAPNQPGLDFLERKDQLVEMVRTLSRRQLVKRDVSDGEGYLSIHRSLQWSIILDLSRNNDQRWAVYQQAFLLIRRGLPMSSPLQTPEPEKWADFEDLSPQVLSLRSHCLWPTPPVDFPVDFAKMLADLGTYMWHAGLISDGVMALETAEEILDDRGVPKFDGLRSDILANLGAISGFCGVSDRREGIERRYNALNIRKEKFESTPKDQLTRLDHVRYINAESDLAFGYLQEERLDEVERIMKRCLREYKSWGDEEEIPFEYAKYYYLMSFVLASQSISAKALNSSEHGLSLISKAAGAEHGMTLLWKFGLANLYCLCQNLPKALDLHKEILDVRKKICGEFNGFTLESYSIYGALLHEDGKSNEADECFQKCLQRRKRGQWEREGVARAQYRHHFVLEALGKHDEAVEELKLARLARDQLLKENEGYLHYDPQRDELEIFDQLCSMWAGRSTGKIAHMQNPSATSSA